MGTIIVNFKNYLSASGEGSVRLAEAAGRVAQDSGQEIIVAPPTTMLGLVARSVKIPVFAQGVTTPSGEKTTGSVPPESVKAAGARGTILNHSEQRIPRGQMEALVPRLAELQLRTCLCARTPAEAGSLAAFSTEYIAMEPPELIGTGVAVSKAKPGAVTRTVKAAREAGYRGRVLCGAGIVSGEDVAAAARLGADGVLVSSSVVKARDWEAKLSELAGSLF